MYVHVFRRRKKKGRACEKKNRSCTRQENKKEWKKGMLETMKRERKREREKRKASIEIECVYVKA